MFHCLVLMDEDYIFTLCAGDPEVKAKWTISAFIRTYAIEGFLPSRGPKSW